MTSALLVYDTNKYTCISIILSPIKTKHTRMVIEHSKTLHVDQHSLALVN